METFVVAITAKPGSEDQVSEFYLKQQNEYAKAKGFRGRQILRAQHGTMVNALRKYMSDEEIASHPEPDLGEKGVHFVIIEHWDSVDDRMAYSQSRDKTVDRELFPLLQPAHSHEFYTDITA